MTMFTAYFDASGHPDQSAGALFVSGAISTVEKWTEFEAGWRALLNRYGVPFLHMKDFKMGIAPFERFKGNRLLQHQLEHEALTLIQASVLRTFGQGIVIPDFRRMHQEFVIPSTHYFGNTNKHPFSHCGLGVVLDCRQWIRRYCKKKEIVGQVEYVFDRGDKHRGEFAKAMRLYFDDEPIFRSSGECPPLQAADMIAWYHRRSVSSLKDGGLSRLGSPLRQLILATAGADRWNFAEWSKLRHYCKEQGFERQYSEGS